MNLAKGLFIIILMIGIISLIVYFSTESITSQSTKIVYKYLPRTLEEEENDPVYVSDIFKTMFTQPSVWVTSSYEDTIRRTEVPNKNFISQV